MARSAPPTKRIRSETASAGPGRPRKLTRQLIVDTALQVLDEEGYQPLSMRSLAQRLGVNHATLYNYVGHVEDIEVEAIATLTARMPIPSLDRPEPMREQLIEHLLALRELQIQHPHVLHPPMGSPTWRSHQVTSNQVMRALMPHGSSLGEVMVAAPGCDSRIVQSGRHIEIEARAGAGEEIRRRRVGAKHRRDAFRHANSLRASAGAMAKNSPPDATPNIRCPS